MTTIYVTHDQVEAMTLGERVAVMRRGELQQVAAPQELYDRPANLFVAGFIGSPAMNFFQGVLEERRRRSRVAFGDGSGSRSTSTSARSPPRSPVWTARG